MYVLVCGKVTKFVDTKKLCRGHFGVGTHKKNSEIHQHFDMLPTFPAKGGGTAVGRGCTGEF